MSTTFEECITLYKSEMDNMGMKYDETLLSAVAKGLGPSIYNNDASTVASSDNEELERVDKNYLQGKLGLSSGSENMTAIKEVAEAMGTSNRNKYRAIFYYLLCVKFGKEGVYA